MQYSTFKWLRSGSVFFAWNFLLLWLTEPFPVITLIVRFNKFSFLPYRVNCADKRIAFVTFCESNAKALSTGYALSKVPLRPPGVQDVRGTSALHRPKRSVDLFRPTDGGQLHAALSLPMRRFASIASIFSIPPRYQKYRRNRRISSHLRFLLQSFQNNFSLMSSLIVIENAIVIKQLTVYHIQFS